MHQRLNFLYECDCDSCKKNESINLALKGDSKKYLKAVEKAFKRLHSNGNYKPEDLNKTPEFKELVKQTSGIFESAITDNDISEEMLKSLKENVFVFSGLKTHAELLEASKLLLTDDNKIKSFSQFSKDVEKIKSGYNENYLDSEYQFALTSSEMAGKWSKVSKDYDLQYRTANDSKVRDSHKLLHNITLPADDSFWIYYYPPNGWKCRCNALEVLKGKYDLSDSKTATSNGEKATSQIGKDGKNKLEIFRFNPGIDKVVFPPAHPYYKVEGASIVEKSLKADL